MAGYNIYRIQLLIKICIQTQTKINMLIYSVWGGFGFLTLLITYAMFRDPRKNNNSEHEHEFKNNAQPNYFNIDLSGLIEFFKSKGK